MKIRFILLFVLALLSNSCSFDVGSNIINEATIDVGDQKIYTDIGKVYKTSTSRFGVGPVPKSRKTPLGKFQIAEKIGCGEDVHQNFDGRVPVGRSTGIKTRIVWLKDSPSNKQSTTYGRYIYIHGSDCSVGIPTSNGCVHLLPYDMIDFYNRINKNTVIKIRR